MAKVVLEDVSKSFPSQRRPPESDQRDPAQVPADLEPSVEPAAAVLRQISFSVADGEFMVLVGPSGCGKSTLLRLISGLETLTGGNIWVGEQRVNTLPPKQRDIAMVFQSYALYPHLNVYDNLAFGLRRMRRWQRQSTETLPNPGWQAALVTATRRLPKSLRYQSAAEKQIDRRVRRVAQMLQIEALLYRLPRQLSGGQKQRVALGRAMARNPQVFLMDEPLSNLDAKLRTETRAQIVALQRQLGTTTLYVTHDQTEAMTMGDRIAVMNAGQIQQIAPPLELYRAPANRFVAAFIGSPPMNFLPVIVTSTGVKHPAFELTLPPHWQPALSPYQEQPATLGIRPEHFQLYPDSDLSLTVQRVEALGSETFLTAALNETILQIKVSPDYSIQPGETVQVSIERDRVHLFDPNTEAAIRPLAP